MDDVLEAITYMTATVPTMKLSRLGEIVTITAPGYRAGPAC